MSNTTTIFQPARSPQRRSAGPENTGPTGALGGTRPQGRYSEYGQVDPLGLDPNQPASSPGRGQVRSARNPALDGYRGAALIGMMAWHGGIESVKGGFARMTIFFVLSGFLATLSYTRLHDREAKGAFRSFWLRRARRLLPITLVGLVISIGYTLAWGTRDMVDSLRGDVWSVIGYGSNWRFISSGRSYSELFERPSALQHYWTLSLEEQCFAALPVVLAVVSALGRRHARFATAALVAAVVTLGAALPAWIPQSPDTVYYGTHVRGAEFLVGVIAARWLISRGTGTTNHRGSTLANVAGGLSLASLLWVMMFLDRETDWLYRGGMVLFALPAALTLLSALDSRSVVHRVLGVRPLAALGRWAFPIYVIHWPVFQFIDRQLDLARTVEIVLGFTVSIGAGALMHRYYELPLMTAARTRREPRDRGQWLVPDRPLLFGVAGVTAMLALAAGLPGLNPTEVSFDAAAAQETLARQVRMSAELAADPTARERAGAVRDDARTVDTSTVDVGTVETGVVENSGAVATEADQSNPTLLGGHTPSNPEVAEVAGPADPLASTSPSQPVTSGPGEPGLDGSERLQHSETVDLWQQRVVLGNLGALELDPEQARKVLARPPRPPIPDTGSRAGGLNRRMAMFGDSTALSLALTMNEGDLPSDTFDWGIGYTNLGCVIMRGVERPASDGVFLPEPTCEEWEVMYPAAAIESQIEIAGVLFGPGDTYPIRFTDAARPGATADRDRWFNLDDAEYQDYLRSETEAMVAALRRGGVSVVALFTLPVVTKGVEGDGWTRRNFGEHHIPWVHTFNRIMSEVAASSDATVLVDFAEAVAAMSEDEANRLLFDGVHVKKELAFDLLVERLLPMVEAQVNACDECPRLISSGVREPTIGR